MVRRALCLVNPKAKTGTAGLERVRALLAAQGLSAEVHPTTSLEEGRRLLRERGRDADLVVIGGGDGTLSNLAGAILESGKPLGILPMGTANDLARSLELPTDLEEAVAIIVAGRIAALDVGLLAGDEGASGRDERPFVNVATLGLGADVARYHRGPRKRWLGVLAYPLSWWDAWRASRPFRLTLTLDGEKRQCRCMQLAVGCGRHYGGGLTLDETASHFDGLLHLYYVKPQTLTGWLLLLPALFLGRFRRRREVVTWTGREAKVVSRRPRTINLDGELAATTPACFRVRPAALRVFLPEKTLTEAAAARRETPAERLTEKEEP